MIVGEGSAPAPRAAPQAPAWAGRLDQLIAEFAGVSDLESITEIVVSHVAAALGARTVALSLVEGEMMVLAGIRGVTDQAAAAWARHPIDAPLPAADAIRSGRPVILIGLGEIGERYPALAELISEERSVIALPMIADGRRLGAIVLAFADIRRPEPAQLAFLTTLADVCAQAVDRAHARADAAEQAMKLRFLADASAELASSLDYHATLANLARLAVPVLADWCSVQVVEQGQIHTLAVAHVDPAKVTLARELQQRYPVDPEAATGAPAVIRTGVSELIPEVTQEVLDSSALDSELEQLIRELRIHSVLTVPLAARGRVLGALSLVSAESGRSYGPADLAFAEDLARRAALAIDNARLHQEVERTAIRLQRAVLPEQTMAIAGWEVAVHYSPAANDEVGGDFFDVVELDEARVAVVVGDVAGKGVQAAAAMAQIRSAVRAYICLDPDPAVLLGRMDRLIERFEIASLVTLAYLVIDRSNGQMQMGNAGHLPPLAIHPDGTVDTLALPPALPLGVANPQRRTVTTPFPRGAILLAFTDGLVERRGENLDLGLRRLSSAAAALAGSDLPSAMEEMITELTSDCRDDDVTAVALRQIPDGMGG